MLFDRKCQYTKTVKKSDKAPCADFTKMMIEGYTLDRRGSGLDRKSEDEVAEYMEKAMRTGGKDPKCVFVR